jgi:hypothetical protein
MAVPIHFKVSAQQQICMPQYISLNDARIKCMDLFQNRNLELFHTSVAILVPSTLLSVSWTPEALSHSGEWLTHWYINPLKHIGKYMYHML